MSYTYICRVLMFYVYSWVNCFIYVVKNRNLITYTRFANFRFQVWWSMSCLPSYLLRIRICSGTLWISMCQRANGHPVWRLERCQLRSRDPPLMSECGPIRGFQKNCQLKGKREIISLQKLRKITSSSNCSSTTNKPNFGQNLPATSRDVEGQQEGTE